MTVEIPNLWPVEISNSAVRSPLFILRHQAGLVRQQTGNLIEGEVSSEEKGNQVEHSLDLIVPALKRYRYRLLLVTHSKVLVYPCSISDGQEGFGDEGGRANSQGEFVRQLGEYLKSEHTRSVIDSLIAQANDVGDPLQR